MKNAILIHGPSVSSRDMFLDAILEGVLPCNTNHIDGIQITDFFGNPDWDSFRKTDKLIVIRNARVADLKLLHKPIENGIEIITPEGDMRIRPVIIVSTPSLPSSIPYSMEFEFHCIGTRTITIDYYALEIQKARAVLFEMIKNIPSTESLNPIPK